MRVASARGMPPFRLKIEPPWMRLGFSTPKCSVGPRSLFA